MTRLFLIGSIKNLDIKFPKQKTFFGKRMEKLRYGENPHQKSSIYLRI